MFTTASQSSSLMRASSESLMMPALFTRISGGPQLSRSRWNMALTSSDLVTSACTETAEEPSLVMLFTTSSAESACLT
jgi:hypothetical protein